MKDNKFKILTRSELKSAKASNFNEGDVVLCGKYRIWIKYGAYSKPSFMTVVSTRDDMRDLPMRKHPKYIREFIEN